MFFWRWYGWIRRRLFQAEVNSNKLYGVINEGRTYGLQGNCKKMINESNYRRYSQSYFCLKVICDVIPLT